MTSDRSWFQTYTAKVFRPKEPESELVCIEDIAHHLSNICRYNGACRSFYSVAQHSVLVSRIVPREDALWGLLHDAGEAYIGDMVRPLKIHMLEFQKVEEGVMKAVCERFGLNPKQPASVTKADMTILATEKRDLCREAPIPWGIEHIAPITTTISPWPPQKAKEIFLEEFRNLFEGE